MRGRSGCSSSLGRVGPAPWQQLVDPVGRVVGDTGEDVGEVGLRIHAVQLRRLDDRVENGGTMPPGVRRDLIMPGSWDAR